MAKKKLNYEEALARVEEIAESLENENITLENSIDLYKEGMELTLFCRSTLDTAEKEIMQLKETFDGKYNLAAFDSVAEV